MRGRLHRECLAASLKVIQHRVSDTSYLIAVVRDECHRRHGLSTYVTLQFPPCHMHISLIVPSEVSFRCVLLPTSSWSVLHQAANLLRCLVTRMSECLYRALLLGGCFCAQCYSGICVCGSTTWESGVVTSTRFLWFGTHGTSCAKDEDECWSMFLSFAWGWLVCFRHGATQFLPLCIFLYLEVSAFEAALMDGSALLLVRKLG